MKAASVELTDVIGARPAGKTPPPISLVDPIRDRELRDRQRRLRDEEVERQARVQRAIARNAEAISSARSSGRLEGYRHGHIDGVRWGIFVGAVAGIMAGAVVGLVAVWARSQGLL